MRTGIKGFAQVNIPIFIMSLVLSLVLWAVVVSQDANRQSETATVQLTYVGLSPNLALIDEPRQLQVVATAAPEDLKAIQTANLVGRVNLSAARPGKGRYSVALPAVLRDVTTPSLPQIELSIESVESRWINVTVGTKGHLSDTEVVLATAYYTPKKVMVSGPRTQVTRVAEARVTLDLAGVDPMNPSPVESYIYLYDSRGIQIQEQSAGLTIDQPTAAVTPVFNSAPQTKSMAILVRFKGQPGSGYRQEGYECRPSTVVTTGKSIAMAKLSTVETEPIDLTGLSHDRQFTVPIVLPPGVTMADPPRVKVRVSIRPEPPTSKP